MAALPKGIYSHLFQNQNTFLHEEEEMKLEDACA